MPKRINRRGFLGRTAAAVAVPCVVPSAALGLAGTVAPSNRIAMGFIGLGGRGSGGLRTFMAQPDVQVVAVCDTSTENSWRSVYAIGGLDPCRRLAGLSETNAYRDFRELLARDDIDAVQIATGERWHPVISAAAARAGKDVYCEKPLARSIEDGRRLRDLCHRYGTVFQFGTQQRSSRTFRFACELVRNGRIGRLHTIKVGVYGSHTDFSPPGMTAEHYRIGTVPKELDYEMWTGPAPMRPFISGVVQHNWNFVSDYGWGFIHNWGIHHLDIVQWGNGTDFSGPMEVEGKGVTPRGPSYVDTMTAWCVEMRYANGVRLIYTDNRDKTAWQMQANDKQWIYQQVGEHPKNRQGVLFEGTDGWVFINRDTLDAHPRSLLKEKIGPEEIHLTVSPLHERNFLDCVKNRSSTISNIDVAVRSDALCHLSLIAVALGRKLKWDPDNEQFVDDDQANRMLARAHRQPWCL